MTRKSPEKAPLNDASKLLSHRKCMPLRWEGLAFSVG